MEKIYETRTEQEAIELAVREFGVNEDFLEVEILDKAKGRIFNRSGKMKIKISVHGLPDLEEYNSPPKESHKVFHEDEELPPKEEASEEHKTQICTIIENLIACLGIKVTASLVLENNYHMVILDLGDEIDQNLLIGRHGKNIEAIQNITNSIIQKQVEGFNDFIVVEIEEYRKRRSEWLSDIARKKANQVLHTKKSYLLDSLGPFDRKLIHHAVKNMDGVSTISQGNGYYKRVQIFLDE